MIADAPAIDFNRAITLLEQASDQGDDIWDTTVNLGIVAVQDQDQRNYNIGDLSVMVGKKYGEDTIGEWAKAIGADVARVKEYRTTCAYWEKSARADILRTMPRVNYSLLRLTANRFASTAEAVTFLEECCDNEWSVERARLVIKERKGEVMPPEKVADVHVVITGVYRTMGTMTVKFIGGMFPAIDEGLNVRLVMYATKDTGE